MRRSITCLISLCHASARPPRRTASRGPSTVARRRVLAGGVHRLAQARYDRGAVDAVDGAAACRADGEADRGQRAELEELVANQQNPSSPLFHKWLTPEEFGNRFGLSPSDHSKVVAWLDVRGLPGEGVGAGAQLDRVQRDGGAGRQNAAHADSPL